MKILNVPITSVSEVKKNPSKIFKQAIENNTGVYVLNRNDVAGVMLSQEQYENLNKQIDYLEEKLLDYQAMERLKTENIKTYTDEEVRGAVVREPIELDDNDGWE